jgi:hypothetical protein
MTYRHTAKQKRTALVSLLMLCAALVPGLVGTRSRHHGVRVHQVRQANRVAQANDNQVNVVAVGGNATATCSPNNGNNMATGGTLAVAVNLNICVPVAIGGPAIAVNTGNITQAVTNAATLTNTSGR